MEKENKGTVSKVRGSVKGLLVPFCSYLKIIGSHFKSRSKLFKIFGGRWLLGLGKQWNKSETKPSKEAGLEAVIKKLMGKEERE